MSANHPFHGGELAAQVCFTPDWSEGHAERLGRIVANAISEEQARFMEGLYGFFLATADAAGNCDCSFKGSDPGADGKPLPPVRVISPHRLLFPDYSGNGMFNSLGNLLENPRAGMIFIDFAAARRLRINGGAKLLEAGERGADGFPWRELWPQAPRAVEIAVEQVYWNCPARIPRRP